MWLIIGYGNQLRGDDGVGYRLAEKLQLQLPTEQTRVLALHQLTPELALELAAPEIERVLFLDARRGQWEPLILTPLDANAAAGSCGHQLSPELLLHLAASLYGHAPTGYLLTLPAVDMEFGDRLSPTADAALAFSLGQIRNLMDSPTGKGAACHPELP